MLLSSVALKEKGHALPRPPFGGLLTHFAMSYSLCLSIMSEGAFLVPSLLTTAALPPFYRPSEVNAPFPSLSFSRECVVCCWIRVVMVCVFVVSGLDFSMSPAAFSQRGCSQAFVTPSLSLPPIVSAKKLITNPSSVDGRLYPPDSASLSSPLTTRVIAPCQLDIFFLPPLFLFQIRRVIYVDVPLGQLFPHPWPCDSLYFYGFPDQKVLPSPCDCFVFLLKKCFFYSPEFPPEA